MRYQFGARSYHQAGLGFIDGLRQTAFELCTSEHVYGPAYAAAVARVRWLLITRKGLSVATLLNHPVGESRVKQGIPHFCVRQHIDPGGAVSMPPTIEGDPALP